MEQQKLQELLRQMSLDEKINQLFQGNGSLYEDGGIATGPAMQQGFSEQTVKEAGSLLSVVGAENVKKIQKQHIENHPHHIPLLFMADIINGYKTVFPIPLAQGAAFDEAVAKEGAEIAAKESAAAGIHVTFSPMADLVRDARWGRVMESNGEDPYLNSVYAKALVEGYQGADPKKKGQIGACVKHFAAYGAPTAGRDYNNVELSERTLRDSYLPAYEAAVKAGALLVMTSFNTLNHIPSTANKWLMREVLRKEMNFQGVLISDWAAIEEIEKHGMAADKKEAAKLAMEAGCDIDMMTSCYCGYLKELIQSGELEESLLDEAVLRVLELKNKLGLFENPYKDADEEEEKKLLLCKEHREAAKQAAEESFVLLKNKKMLPLEAGKKTALIGPYIDEKAILGAWSIFADEKDAVTIKEGIQRLSIDGKKVSKDILYAKGCSLVLPGEEIGAIAGGSGQKLGTKEGERILLEEAVRVAAEADQVVLCLGEHVSWTGEGGSRADLRLPKRQRRLLKEVTKVNPNTAVVLFCGRPLDLREVKKEVKALMVVWMPGTEGGNAIAEVLYGQAEPGGRLPMSFPYCTAQEPVFYNEFLTGRRNNKEQPGNRFQSKYQDIPNEPLYPFGYGLSYTEFHYSEVRLSADELKKDGSLTASVTIKNVGKRAGKTVAQLYIQDLKGSVVRPVRELKGFQKIELMPDEEKEASFMITEEMLRFYDINMNFKAESGAFHVFIGADSTTENGAEFTYTE